MTRDELIAELASAARPCIGDATDLAIKMLEVVEKSFVLLPLSEPTDEQRVELLRALRAIT